MNVGIAETAESFNELLSTNTDAIVIATPPEMHADQAIAAIEHGKAVFVRKPLGIDLHETQLVVDVARGNCVLLGVDLPYRLDVVPSSSASITLADDALLFDAVDTALFAMRAPRVLRVLPTRIELAANRFIEISRGNANEVRLDSRTIALTGGGNRALDAFTKRLAESKEFDDSIESIVDAARVVEEMAALSFRA